MEPYCTVSSKLYIVKYDTLVVGFSIFHTFILHSGIQGRVLSPGL